MIGAFCLLKPIKTSEETVIVLALYRLLLEIGPALLVGINT